MTAETKREHLLNLARRRRQWAKHERLLADREGDLMERTRREENAAEHEKIAANYERAAAQEPNQGD